MSRSADASSGTSDPCGTTLRAGRLEAFSDGVFAIAITLLVLEISVPPDVSDDLLDAFFDQWPSYLAYLVSFATIGVTWLRHTAITHYLHGRRHHLRRSVEASSGMQRSPDHVTCGGLTAGRAEHVTAR